MFPPTASFNIDTADENHFLRPITLIGGWDLQNLYSRVSDEFKMIEDKCFLLYYKNKCLTYNRNENFKILENDLLCNKENVVHINLAACFTNDISIISVCQKNHIPIVNPIKVRLKTGKIVFTLKKVYSFFTVDHLLYKMSEVMSVNSVILDFYHKSRKLDMDEILADFYFESGVFNPNVEIAFYRTDMDFTRDPDFTQMILKFLSGQSIIDLVDENISTVYNLKDFITKTRRIPVKQQTLMYKEIVLNGYEILNDFFVLEKDSNATGNITFTLVVQPYYIDVMFVSDYVSIPINESIKLSAMSTIKEMKLMASDQINLSPENFMLAPQESNETIHIPYGDECMLHELGLPQTATIKIMKKISVLVEGENQFDYLIKTSKQTIKQMKKELESSHQRQYKLVMQNELNSDTCLLDISDDEIIRFNQSKSCILM